MCFLNPHSPHSMLRLYHGKTPKVVSPRFKTLSWGRGREGVTMFVLLMYINFPIWVELVSRVMSKGYVIIHPQTKLTHFNHEQWTKAEAAEAPWKWGGTDQKGHLSFARTALLFYENRALSFPKKGTFSPGTKSGGAFAPNAPPVPRPLLSYSLNIDRLLEHYRTITAHDLFSIS